MPCGFGILAAETDSVLSGGAEHQGALQGIQLYNLGVTMAKRPLQRSLKEMKFQVGVWKMFSVLQHPGCPAAARGLRILTEVRLDLCTS